MRKLKILLFVILMYALSGNVYAETSWEHIDLNTVTVSCIETTPFGILVGEYYPYLYMFPYNGLKISRDLGLTWENFAPSLAGAGISSIFYDPTSKTTYVTTRYKINDNVGVFKTVDGATWEHIGPNYPAFTMFSHNNNLYVGTSGRGLWVSHDFGQTWVQTLTDGMFGPYINFIQDADNVVIASSDYFSYRSTDRGNTWTQIDNLIIKTAAKYQGTILAGVKNNSGLYKSTDLGTTWTKVSSWETGSVGALNVFNNRFYAGKLYTNDGMYSIYYSDDFGETWTNTSLNAFSHNGNVLDMAYAVSKPAYLLPILGSGLYRGTIQPQQPEVFQFLETPWDNKSETEFIDKITSFFDHEYPLLGYTRHLETGETTNTTLNYLGIKETQPTMYYSSHDGIDYALTFGTQIKAPADGVARYYYCTDCGHTIKINHQNGYVSIYMHLQDKDLITKSTVGVAVKAGNVIGRVGMTGRTTGPHLHFAIQKDTNDWPNNKLDPFGWQADELKDPWENYFWQDSLGQHFGSKSLYLWKSNSGLQERVAYNVNTIILDNKTVKMSQSSPWTIILRNYVLPKLPEVQKGLKYIQNTSILAHAIDIVGGGIQNLDQNVDIEIAFDPTTFSNIKLDSLKIYYWNTFTNLWESIPTIVDLVSNKIIGTTNHFSQFAVFGEQIDITAPTTSILIEDANTTLVTVTLTSNEDGQIMYSLNNSETWEEYVTPIIIGKAGTTTILYKSVDPYGNIEETKETTFSVAQPKGFKKIIKITSAIFNVGTDYSAP